MADARHTEKGQESLFFTLAEDLKTPLLRIAYQAEVTGADDIQATAQNALKLLDAYLLSTKSQAAFELEPVSPSAVLLDVAHELSPHAKKFSCQLQLGAVHHHQTALLHRQALQSALSAIGTVFIEAQGVLGGTRSVELASYKTNKGVAVGIFQAQGAAVLNAQLLAQARAHVGAAARPFAGFSSGAAAQLFVAEQLLSGMGATLRAARRGLRSGLAADLLASSQLQLV